MNNLFKLIGEQELIALMIVDGKPNMAWCADLNLCHREEDLINDIMIQLMKIKKHRKGVWLWSLGKDGTILDECYVGEYCDEPY